MISPGASGPGGTPDPAELAAGLARLVGGDHVHTEGPAFAEALRDATRSQDVTGSALALVLPGSGKEAAAVLGYCYEREVPMTVRGGGTGMAAGAVPNGGVVIGLERLDRIRSVTPERWQMEVEAGVRTADVHRVALENGLQFPPDPGAAGQSTIGGNIATNAGGPHAFGYGVTGRWVTGVEAVVAPGEIVQSGGPLRKDVAGLDLTALMVGSEGTLGIVTAAWLALVPAPEARGAVVAFYPDAVAGSAAIATVTGSGLQPAALEYLDRGALAASSGSFPAATPKAPGFMVFADAEGSAATVAELTRDLREALTPGAIEDAIEITDHASLERFWRWRSGVSFAVAAIRGGKAAEDIVVPGEHLAEAIAGIVSIGDRHGLPACSWGHAGDGNLHANFLLDPDDKDALGRAGAAVDELLRMALRMGGSITGEHGIGSLKLPWVEIALDPVALRLQREIKRSLDPKGLLNPGKKIPPA